MASVKDEALITPGNEAVLSVSNKIIERPFNARHTLSWRQGIFYFQNASLEEISHVLPRWYGINVVLDNPSLTSRKFTGIVDKNKPIEVFMSNIKKISGINSYLDRDNVLHFE